MWVNNLHRRLGKGFDGYNLDLIIKSKEAGVMAYIDTAKIRNEAQIPSEIQKKIANWSSAFYFKHAKIMETETMFYTKEHLRHEVHALIAFFIEAKNDSPIWIYKIYDIKGHSKLKWFLKDAQEFLDWDYNLCMGLPVTKYEVNKNGKI